MNLSRLFAGILSLALAAPAIGADEPGVFKVPGTDSTIKFYGYVQLDATLDFQARVNDIEDNDWATFLPGVPDKDSAIAKRKSPQLYMTGRTSRFGIQTNTPSSAGNIGVRLEGDFNGPNGFQSETFTNSVLFRLRHAYGTVGGLLVGQTWSTFLDLGAAPDTVDFNGPGSLALVRNPMIRYAFGLAPGANLTLGAENARGSQFGGAKFQTIPDFHANFTYAGPWGHLSVRGVTQQYNVFEGDISAKTAFSVAGALSGSFKVGGDTLVAQVSGGPGIGRYLLNASGATINLPGADPAAIGGNPGAFRIEANGDLKLITVYAYHVGFTHVWSPALRSNLVWSQTFIQDPKPDGVEAGNDVEKTLSQAFVNTFWGFAKNCEFGIELAWGQWKSFSTAASPELEGDQTRINASFHYNFF
jgi:DcaP outer membrane protein